MFRPPSPSLPALAGLCAAAMFMSIGCSDSEENVECGGNGQLHDDHCHCDPGYTPTEQELSCVAVDAGMAEDTGGDPNQLSFTPFDTAVGVGTTDDRATSWILAASHNDYYLSLEIRDGFEPGNAPLTVEFAEEQTQLSTCAVCLVLKTEGYSEGGGLRCEQVFMPRTEGSLEMDAIGGSQYETFSGALHDMAFQQVDIVDDLTTVPHSAGGVRYLDSWDFRVRLDSLDNAGDADVADTLLPELLLTINAIASGLGSTG